MSLRALLTPQAQQQVVQTIKDVEAKTSAEVVVALRKRSGSYRHADYLFGFLLVLSAVSAFLALPNGNLPAAAPIDLALIFLIGSAICAWVPPLRRAFAGPGLLRQNVAVAARSAFVEMGICRTVARGGVLIYVSVLEKRVEVVPDIGINVALIGEEWSRQVRELQRAVSRGDLAGFVAALRGVGGLLARHYPHQLDDRNELPDEVSTP
jgi:putative membrane protein